MNPQYATPQQHGIPPNPYGSFPSQGMQQPQPAQQKLPQQHFPPQPNPGPQNNFPSYGMAPNHANAGPSPIASSMSPPLPTSLNSSVQSGPPNHSISNPLGNFNQPNANIHPGQQMPPNKLGEAPPGTQSSISQNIARPTPLNAQPPQIPGQPMGLPQNANLPPSVGLSRPLQHQPSDFNQQALGNPMPGGPFHSDAASHNVSSAQLTNHSTAPSTGLQGNLSGPPGMGPPPVVSSGFTPVLPQQPPQAPLINQHQPPSMHQQQQRMPMPARPGTTFPNPVSGDLSGQMSGMNLNGPTPSMPPNQPMMVNGPHTGIPPMPGQRIPSLNGGPTPQMNGVLDPNAPRSPMQQRYPPDNPQHLQGGYPQAMPPPMQGGYMPQPGYPPQPAPFPSAQPSYPQAQPNQTRLDPDLMPSPVQVFLDDQRDKSGVFYTNQKGQVPPLVTTNFTVVDQGNSSPHFIRSTMYNVPETADMLKQTAVPFALVISPMAELYEDEHSPPLVDFGPLGPVRCIRCKAYMCPNMKFYDGGRRFNCLLCKASTEVPEEYFQHLDHTGLRMDRFERPELMLGTYDIIATKEYCRDDTLPKPPALIFLIDVSYNNVKSGLVSLLCSQMMHFLDHLPKERGQEKSSLRVGFITYNSSVHFYNIKPNLGQPQMLVVGDVHEMFMPLLDGFLADVEESKSLIEMLMQQIPTLFAETRETETILAPAIQAGLEALKAAGCAGKLLVFHSSLPSLEAPGKLKNRDDRKVLGTEKEKTVLTPQNKVYNDLGQDCVQAGCSVDLFIFNNSFIDLPTIGQVARLTGGEVYKYTYFQADLDGDRTVADVRSSIRRLCAFDAVMRVRTSAGVRPTDFYGHFFMSNTTDIELASIDPDKAVAVEIKHDDKLSEAEGVYIQAALLYTSLSGQRRIRIINLALKATNQISELFRACELDTLMNFFTKQAIFKTLEATPKAIKENYIHRCAQVLACYRKNCAAPTSAGQLILPECMKLLPLYINCMLKSDAVSGGSDMTIDDRWFMMASATTMDVPSSVVYLYPKLLPLIDGSLDNPIPIRCSAEKMLDNGVYLLENGIYMFLWLGLAVPSEWVMSVFGVPTTSQVDTEKNKLPVLDNPISERVRDIIDLVGFSRHRSMRLTIVRQRDKMELVMKHFLVEDKGLDGSASYVDFLCHVHREIRDIIS